MSAICHFTPHKMPFLNCSRDVETLRTSKWESMMTAFLVGSALSFSKITKKQDWPWSTYPTPNYGTGSFESIGIQDTRKAERKEEDLGANKREMSIGIRRMLVGQCLSPRRSSTVISHVKVGTTGVDTLIVSRIESGIESVVTENSATTAIIGRQITDDLCKYL